MGFVKKGLLVVAVIFLFFLFLAGNTFLTLGMSLDYEVVKPELASTVKNLAGEKTDLTQDLNNNFNEMELSCQNNSEFLFSNAEYTFEIPCDVVAHGSDAVVNHGINFLVDDVYYGDYDCDFWDCLEKTESPFFMVSEKAKNYWDEKFYLSLGVIIILLLLMFFLVEKKQNLFLISGFLLIVSSLPFMKLDWFVNLFSDNLFLDFLSVFFIKAHTVFLLSFIIGIILFGIGILMKFFDIGLKISNFFSKKDSKEVVKKKEEKSK